MSFLSQAIVTVKRPYFAVRMHPFFWTKTNKEAMEKFLQHPPILNEVQTRLVESLNKDGIAFTSIQELFPNDPEMLARFQGKVEEMRATVVQNRKKGFLLDFFGSKRTLDFKNPFTNYSLSPEVMDVVNSYLKMWSRFYYFYLGETLPDSEAAAAGSQRWHRDPEDRRMCKVFIYLTDVLDVNAGPFTYAKGSQVGGPNRSYFPQKFPQGSYPPAGAVEKVIAEKDILPCFGKAGTIIFADTSGLHKGGLSITIPRTMYTSGYSSFASHFKHMYDLPETGSTETLAPAAQYALHRD